MSLKIGITGGIGSGKSTVCQLFELLKIPVLYADPLAKRLMTERLGLRADLIKICGKETFRADGSLDTAFMASQIFNNSDRRSEVNRCVHAQVRDYAVSWFGRQKGPYAIEEAALIFESGSDQWLDKVIVVDAPFKVRLERLQLSRAMSEEEVLEREKSQLSAQEKVKKADFVIVNDHSESLIEQVFKIHCTLVDISKLNIHASRNPH